MMSFAAVVCILHAALANYTCLNVPARFLQLYREHSNDAMMLKHFIDFFDGKPARTTPLLPSGKRSTNCMTIDPLEGVLLRIECATFSVT
jgi:hypothetical protein